MKITNFLMIALIAIISVGCGSQTIKTDVRVEVIAPPDSLLTDVAIEPPPNIEQYIGMRWIDKEEVLIDKFRAQSINAESANAQLKSIREWKEKTLKLYEKKE